MIARCLGCNSELDPDEYSDDADICGTPEQQAGEEARKCPQCNRISIHQHAGVCMVPGCGGKVREKERMTEREWHENFDNVLGLADWLDSECGYFKSVSDCIYFFEKPWKWGWEYKFWRMWLDAEGDTEKCELIVEAMLNDVDPAEVFDD